MSVTWIKDIKRLFTEQDASCMIYYGPYLFLKIFFLPCFLSLIFLTNLDLSNYKDVKAQAVTIWEHVALGSMPIGAEPWPKSQCDLFRLWIDQGMLYDNLSDPTPVPDPIPIPPIKPGLKVRKDILSLTPEELMEYREAVERLEPMNPNSLWAICGNLHGQWCLHYQEAFLFWHRAHLLYMERLLGVPIPYWNWMDASAPINGIPKAYSDPTYVARDGTTKRNPLYNALGQDGVTLTSRSPDVAKPDYIKLIELYQQQVATANLNTTFSLPQGALPWANLPDFTPHQEDSAYADGKETYDRYMEQPHDNVHGWIGGDMANNAKTAFDPIFYAHHSNIDRLFYNWQVAHQNAQYTVATPILPFVSGNATVLKDPYRPDNLPYVTTIGDLARDIRQLGYTYQMPSEPENFCKARTTNYKTANLVLLKTPDYIAQNNSKDNAKLLLRIPGVKCTHESYTLFFFIYKNKDHPPPTLQDAQMNHPHFCSMQHRNGMGETTNTERCIKTGVVQSIDITAKAQQIGINSPDLPDIVTLTIASQQTKLLSSKEAESIPGTQPKLQWVYKIKKSTLGAQPSCCPATRV